MSSLIATLPGSSATRTFPPAAGAVRLPLPSRSPAVPPDRLEAALRFSVMGERPWGETERIPVWVVSVAGRLYARASNGVRTMWYAPAAAQGLDLSADGTPLRVIPRPVSDPRRFPEIVEAFLAKYPMDPQIGSMLAPGALWTTVELQVAEA